MKQLQRLYHERLPIDSLTTPEFAQRLAAISTDIHQPLCTYINRRGQVIRVGVGTPRQTQFSLLELPRYGSERLCGIRCIATELKQEPPKESSLTAMALQRLDALVILTLTGTGMIRRGGGATGYVEQVYLAHLTPQSQTNVNSNIYWSVSPPLNLEDLSKQDFLELVEGLEAEFQREFTAITVDTAEDRVLLVGLMTRFSGANDRYTFLI